jgi:thioredoxin-dependent peroxiredoxin
VIAAGTTAPPFTLPTDTGDRLSLKSLRGKWVVLYFYPEDDTDVCTAQACSFREVWDEVKGAGIVVLGVSPDGVESHASFRKKYKLPFTLLADPDHAVATAFGAWGEKTLYGNTFIGMHRNAVVIDPMGKVAKVFTNVRSKGFAARMVKAVGELKE